MPPTAYSEIGEAKETAEMVAALWDRHRANVREILNRSKA